MEALMPLLSLLVLVGSAGLVIAEIVHHQRLTPWMVSWLAREARSPVTFCPAPSAASLEGLGGVSGGARWRWDPDSQRVLFARPLGMVKLERGYPAGFLQRGEDGGWTLYWKPTPVSLLGVGLVLACVGALGLVTVEGEVMGLLVVPAAALALAFVGLIAKLNARATLERLVLPALAEALQEHLDG